MNIYRSKPSQPSLDKRSYCLQEMENETELSLSGVETRKNAFGGLNRFFLSHFSGVILKNAHLMVGETSVGPLTTRFVGRLESEV